MTLIISCLAWPEKIFPKFVFLCESEGCVQVAKLLMSVLHRFCSFVSLTVKVCQKRSPLKLFSKFAILVSAGERGEYPQCAVHLSIDKVRRFFRLGFYQHFAPIRLTQLFLVSLVETLCMPADHTKMISSSGIFYCPRGKLDCVRNHIAFHRLQINIHRHH